MTAVMIDWSTAVVKPKGRYLELAVRLSTAPDLVWKKGVRAHQPPDGRRRVRALVGDRPGLRRAHRRRHRGGTEAVVRKRLDAMMRQTNAAATRARKERDEIAYARQQAVKAQEESAKQMTERFRSPG